MISGDGMITVTISNNGTIAPTGGTLTIIPAFANNGTIAPDGALAILSGGAITNLANIEGFGEINNNISNSGLISAAGGRLALSGVVTNAVGGQITAGAGDELDIAQGLANPGIISLTGGMLNTGSGTLTNTGQITGFGTIRTGGLTNNGTMVLTGGTTTVNGPVINSLGQTIVVKDSPGIFTGAVVNNGTLKSTNTIVTFTGSYSGNAYISDPSTNIFQNNVTVVSGGSMTGNTGDQYFFSNGSFTNQGTFSNGGLLQSFDSTINNGQFTVFGTSANFINGQITGTGTLAVGSGASPGNLQLSAGSFADAQHALTLTAGSTLDLTNNSIVINYGGGTDPVASIYGYLKSGYAGGAWTGTGINSSIAALPANNANFGVGFVDGADNIPGATITSGQILIAYALYGDVNLDGLVNATDFAIFGANFNTSVTGWDHGDFTYSGLVNATDFALLGANFGKSASGGAIALPASDYAALDAFAAANGLALPSVPEPGSLGLLTAGLMGMVARRRRRGRLSAAH